MNDKPSREAVQTNLGIDLAAGEPRRNPAEIRRIFFIPSSFTSTRQGPAADTDEAITGRPEHWAATLTHFALDFGFRTFVLAAPADVKTLTALLSAANAVTTRRGPSACSRSGSGPTRT